ncbi:Creatinase/aminopeptidase [Rhizoclosmatium globosum]|uniref:Creatinase/aminopeptidase n=1 Tax=Rhizoclosmatium globosum TaxID=329046 RepID=A0A1Y2BFF5_9FUNG|nr:Creatinase/aminopeptidase [Rhizoclosmatium globosum]|eukprot:ORY33549.1 Creatinase/aminopeptidase [Rhizoclosmatium globosum]
MNPFDPFPLRSLAIDNRQRTLARLLPKASTGVVFITSSTREFFYYLTGLTPLDSDHPFALLLELPSGRTTLFSPEYDDEFRLWNATPKTFDELRAEVGVDSVVAAGQLGGVLEKILGPVGAGGIVHILDSTLEVIPDEVKRYNLKRKEFTHAITESRVFKSTAEISLLRQAAEITSKAHIQLMKTASIYTYEKQLEAEYVYSISMSGARNENCILSSARSRKPRINLVDSGVVLYGYVSDVSRTFPRSGRFVGDWKLVYEAVLDAHKAVCQAMRPGVEWEDLHRLADRVMLGHLVKIGVCNGDFEELVRNHVGALFFPHGVGHLIGLEGHDVGGYPDGVKPIDEPGIDKLRMRRKLEAGMVVTVEPGLYFNSNLIQKAVKGGVLTEFLDLKRVKEIEEHVGGVRIEDMVLVTEEGCEVLSKDVPKEVADIEKIMKGAMNEKGVMMNFMNPLKDVEEGVATLKELWKQEYMNIARRIWTERLILFLIFFCLYLTK